MRFTSTRHAQLIFPASLFESQWCMFIVLKANGADLVFEFHDLKDVKVWVKIRAVDTSTSKSLLRIQISRSCF